MDRQLNRALLGNTASKGGLNLKDLRQALVNIFPRDAEFIQIAERNQLENTYRSQVLSSFKTNGSEIEGYINDYDIAWERAGNPISWMITGIDPYKKVDAVVFANIDPKIIDKKLIIKALRHDPRNWAYLREISPHFLDDEDINLAFFDGLKSVRNTYYERVLSSMNPSLQNDIYFLEKLYKNYIDFQLYVHIAAINPGYFDPNYTYPVYLTAKFNPDHLRMARKYEYYEYGFNELAENADYMRAVYQANPELADEIVGYELKDSPRKYKSQPRAAKRYK